MSEGTIDTPKKPAGSQGATRDWPQTRWQSQGSEEGSCVEENRGQAESGQCQ